MSRETVIAVEEGVDRTKYPYMKDETKEWDAKCGRWGDVTISMVYKTMHNVELVSFPDGCGHYHQRMGDEQVLKALERTEHYLPVVFHYPLEGRGYDWFYEKDVKNGVNYKIDN